MALRDHRLAVVGGLATRFAVFAALAALHTWPLATGLTSLSRHDNADALLNEWILAWVAHALATNPLGLFDANIFHPEARTLAFSEHLLTPSLVATPLLWLGVPTLAAHNLSLLAGLALTGWAMSLVIERWTGSVWAGLVAGSLLAFNAHTLTRLGHLQAMHVEFLPLALFALDRVVTRGRRRDALFLVAATVLQALASGYLLVMTALALVAAAASRAREWIDPRARTAWLLVGSAALSCLLLWPFVWLYARVSREQGLVRSLDEVAIYSATLRSYLSTGARLHYETWARDWFAPDSLFPGVVAMLLAALYVRSGEGLREPRARMLVALGALGVALSFGPALPGYAWLHAHVPGLQGLRGPARFGLLGLLAVAGLAGMMLAFLLRWMAARGWSARAVTIAGAAALALVNLEAARAPLEWSPPLRVPAVYAALRDAPPGALIELPFPAADRTQANAPAVLASTRHFRPLVNGYSGFVPASYGEHAGRLAGFPDERAEALLAELGVSHVVVHADRDPPLAARAATADWLEEIAADGPVRLYRIRR